ncbi:sigma-54-dependent Fis family transcriptional regulator [Muribaculaceae bacterium Isolate-113 (HZI)]|jgi:two-component system NtrC family response regulator|nr:sigma-54-dependent Fis family transcriptional regulator [Muribaculaceae bacterium]MBJ2198474.1 sigma-54-dependent Fis family transcriptional regulator [Muribaculaceae bacterium]MCI9029224.1 sigma-54-dependent Fis family transcriptional regulator [Muribaculaceae bacterium]ROT21392.1 sigma-54-dependent Fis family transcriptional regulator [Muribaculaceae bacterium Isolate-114 (HZI)]ROT22543.1 sigma-54-dependent Fis family transcriptional regulator [Muribaculaceae bacterium Isolate-113 (HZI)]
MILIVDDDKAIRQSLALVLKRKGYETALAGNPDEALGMLRKHKFRLVIMDMNYSLSTTGEEGIHLLRQTKIFQPDTPVILITAWGSIELAVEGMRFGAFDFITKPWNNHLLLQRIETALSLSSPATDSDRNPADFDRCGFIGENPRVKELLKTVERIAPTDAPVLVLGENGTGKELIANAIHKNSRRKNAPFVMVNLGGISTSLFESEMFGHSKGAYTGAVSERKGRFELADKGTIFLDEIGDLTQDCQVKLLRVLQQHTFERLGESRTRKTDIRAICATNADLPAMVREHTFREDLFYRINLITLRIPPLRERRDDIPLLARNFMESASRSHGIRCPEISHEALGYLSRLPYPGNVRQLKNMVERAVLMCAGGILEKCDFEADGNIQDVSATDLKGSLEGATLEDLEAAAIAEAVRKYDGNLSRVAAALGITRQSLYRKIEKHGIDIS